MTVSRLRFIGALLCAVLTATSAHHVLAQTPSCPCSIWPAVAVPGNAAANDFSPVEVGTKFQSDVDGFLTAIRFYKGGTNTGPHVGHLWSAAGTLLAEATFAGETPFGWQEVQLSSAVAIAAHTTYVVSYHTDSGRYAFDASYFTQAFDAPPLHALQGGAVAVVRQNVVIAEPVLLSVGTPDRIRTCLNSYCCSCRRLPWLAGATATWSSRIWPSATNCGPCNDA
jgi:hypothetical protein